MPGKKGSDYCEGSFSALRRCFTNICSTPSLNSKLHSSMKNSPRSKLGGPRANRCDRRYSGAYQAIGEPKNFTTWYNPAPLRLVLPNSQMGKTRVHKPGGARRHLLLIILPCTRPAPPGRRSSQTKRIFYTICSPASHRRCAKY
jgi:hypothetical protein